MQFKVILAIATVWLVTAVQPAFVGAPINVDKPFAVALEATTTTTAHALAPRATDPLECDGWCWGGMHCCLIPYDSNTFSRCHSPDTPCSKISFPDGLSAPAPHPPLEATTTAASSASEDEPANSMVTVTQTEAAATVTITVSPAVAAALADISAGQAAKEKLADPTTAPNAQVFTETTVQVISVTATTVVPIIMSPIPPPTTFAYLSASTTNSTSLASSTCLNTTTPASDTEVIGTSSGDPKLGTETDGIPEIVTQPSTVTGVSVAASTTTTSTASLDGEPSAIASSLGSNGAASRTTLGDIGWIVLVALGLLGGMSLGL